VGAWDVGACARDGGAIKGDAVGVVWGDGVEGALEQVLEGGVGVEGALEVAVVAVGDVVGVRVLGACALGDGFACGGDEFGEREVLVGAVGFGSCGVDEVLAVVYWVCVVVLPVGLLRLRVFQLCHSLRDSRWVCCYSRGWGAGMLKMADFRNAPKMGYSRGGFKGKSLPTPVGAKYTGLLCR
jgi:hypothetical protein